MTETPTRHRAPITLTWRHITLGVTLLVDGCYAALLVSGVAIAGHDRFLAPQINQFLVGALGVSTVIAAGLLIARTISTRVDDAVVLVSAIAAQLGDEVAHVKETTKDLSGQMARVKDRLGMREDDDPTVGLRYQPTPVVQHVIGVASPSLYGARVDSVIDRAADRLVERFEEYGRQQHFAGYAACAEDMGGGGTVTALAPRNGHRTTS